ncbi:7-carboxy-7-deazaguanine synthase QueE [Prochlorococcus marinus]|uniref:7-carboxy-7-deazaguanine synthase QueE n=1 Tax=Prochlorococcus marinus TaxID=1219 RepID=UPI0022B51ECE|nr:7-carboxy-7-deazaguanine synthase QueE [Prochlorococcus marinus]
MSSILPVVETFHSLQGEGLHFGKSAFFIRLGGCTVGCPWCDTKESWPIRSQKQISTSDLAKEVKFAQSKGAEFVVLTGGEPLHHNLNKLCREIKALTTRKESNPIAIHLETSGVNAISGAINWITLSPKIHCHPKKSLLLACDELKVVIHRKEDLAFAEEMAKLAKNEKQTAYQTVTYKKQDILEPHLFLQPGWNSKEGTRLTIEYIKKHPQWRLSLQTHKWLEIL